jgi:transcriptional regulator with XRE-family HTH domain
MTQETDYSVAPPETVVADVGRRLERIRLGRNVSQAQLAEQAGVSRRTITRLEKGEGISLDTLIRVLRALGLADRLELLLPDASVRPIDRVRLKGRERQRARPRRADGPSEWTWGDDGTDEP